MQAPSLNQAVHQLPHPHTNFKCIVCCPVPCAQAGAHCPGFRVSFLLSACPVVEGVVVTSWAASLLPSPGYPPWPLLVIRPVEVSQTSHSGKVPKSSSFLTVVISLPDMTVGITEAA